MIENKNQYRKMAPRTGLIVLCLLALPAVRGKMESHMVLHMLLQFPLILLAGWLLAKGIPEQARSMAQTWNHAGVAGLLVAAMVLMFWMIPRALDLVLVDRTRESWKFLTLALAGVALELSWQPAGMIVRGFFLGNVLPMMMVAGWLYIEAPVRLCNSYLSNDQLRTGSGLLALAIAGSVVWLYAFFMPAVREADGKTS